MIMEKEAYTIGEVCKVLGVSRYTVHRILRSGAVRGVKRHSKSLHRILSQQQLELLKTLCCLHRGGVEIRELKKYASLEYGGAKTAAARKAFLETKRRQLWNSLTNIQKAIDHIERKIEVLDQK